MTDITQPELSDSLVEPTHPATKVATFVLGALLSTFCVAWALDVPSYLGVTFYAEQLLTVVLGLATAIVYLSVSWRGRPHHGRVPWFDIVFAAGSLGVLLWMSIQYERLLNDVPYYTPEVVVLSVAIVPLILEALRRLLAA